MKTVCIHNGLLPYSLSSNISKICHFLINILLIVSLIELALFPSYEILYAIIVSIIGCIMCRKLVFTAYNLLYYPVSTLAITFYVFFFMVLPMPATLLELKPVSYNLHDVVNTYTNLLILEVALIITHLLYKLITGHKNFIRSIFYKTNFFARFTSSELWAIILISLFLYVYRILNQGLYDEYGRNTAASLPIEIYVLNLLFGESYQLVSLFYFRKFAIIKQPYSIKNWAIILVAVLSFVVGIASNMRTASILVFANAFFLFIVYIIYVQFDYRTYLKPSKIIPIAILVYIFFGPFMDISKAMLVNRGDRYGVSGAEMLSTTLETYSQIQNEDASFRFIEDSKNKEGIIWDEEYLSNDILNRFCSIKILDETLFHAQRVGYANAEMRQELLLELFDSFPGAIKSWLGIVIPDNFRMHSLTDKLYSLSVHSYYPYAPVGGVKVGTLQGLGLSLFGYWYLVLIIPVFIIIFFFLDATVYFKDGRVYFSLWFFANILLSCYYFSDRHYYSYELRFIMRTYIESVVFYLITINIVKKLPLIKH